MSELRFPYDLPPEVLRHLEQQGPDEASALRDVWELTAGASRPATDDRKQDVRNAVMASVAPAVRRVRPNRPPLRLVTGPYMVRMVSMAACMLVLVAVAFLMSPDIVTYRVPVGQTSSQFTLPDGSTVALSAGSQLSYNATFGRDARMVTLHGRAFFDVEKSTVPFEVHTFDAVTTVLGTSFGVEAWPGETVPSSEVIVATGRVAVASARGEVLVLPGQKTHVVPEDGTVLEPVVVDVQRSLSWRSGGFMYENEPIGNVLEDLERRYDIRLSAPASIRLRPISIWKQQAPTASEVVGDIAATVGVRYRAIKGGYELYLN